MSLRRRLPFILLTGLVIAIPCEAGESQQTRRQPPVEVSVGKSWGDAKRGFYLAHGKGKLRISFDGRAIATYVYRHGKVQRPFFAHVKTRGGSQVTRNFPPVKGTDAIDHATMHPGVWLAFGKLGGSDFWRNKGRVIHEGFTAEPSAGKVAAFATVNRYERPDGSVVCRQHTRFRVSNHKQGWRLSIDAKFAGKKPFAFGVQEEMGLGIRVATPLTVKNGGAILASHGGNNEKGTWGRVGDWWDYFGTIDGRRSGILLMSHANNGRVWSHSRDYGCLVANPFPVDRKENRGKSKVVSPGKTLRLQFALFVHDGNAKRAFDRAAVFRDYVGTSKTP